MIKVCHVIMGHNRHDPRVAQKMCSSLVSAGYDVMLLCADGKSDEEYNNVKIHSIKNSPKNRIQQFLFTKKSLIKEAKKINADIYHIHEPMLLGVGLAMKARGKKIIFDSHEDTLNDIKEKLYIPKALRSVISKLYGMFEKYAVKKFDRVVSVTPLIVDRLKKINVNTVMITNYPKLVNYTSDANYLERENAVCFAGIMSELWNLNKITGIVQNADVRFNLAATYLIEDMYEKLKETDKKGKINFSVALTMNDLYEKVYFKSTIAMALINYCQNIGWKTGTLGITKIFEYMMAGLPVICTDLVLWKEIFEERNCGICVDPSDGEAISKAINFLMHNKEVAYKMGQAGRKLVEEKYNWNSQERILLNLYSELLSD